jgi:hypothetical protein
MESEDEANAGTLASNDIATDVWDGKALADRGDVQDPTKREDYG